MDSAQLRFFRVTCVGASYCGKTSLINAYVNGCFPMRTVPTDNVEVYHRRVEVADEDGIGPSHRPFLLEIEDTPGSELAGSEQAEEREFSGKKIRTGSVVKILDQRDKVLRAFSEHKSLVYRPEVDGVLGRRGTVRQVHKDQSITVALFDGSVFELPLAIVELSSAVDLPVDEYLHLGEKRAPDFTTLQEHTSHNLRSLRPFSASTRPVGNATMDKTVTRRRMGFLICFDLSDDTGESVKEALVLYGMLSKIIAKSMWKLAVPVVWLVGCKSDRCSTESVLKHNTQVAMDFSEEVEIPFYTTSARNHDGVQKLFDDMINAIFQRQQLWSLTFVDNGDAGETAEGGFCHSQ